MTSIDRKILCFLVNKKLGNDLLVVLKILGAPYVFFNFLFNWIKYFNLVDYAGTNMSEAEVSELVTRRMNLYFLFYVVTVCLLPLFFWGTPLAVLKNYYYLYLLPALCIGGYAGNLFQKNRFANLLLQEEEQEIVVEQDVEDMALPERDEGTNKDTQNEKQ